RKKTLSDQRSRPNRIVLVWRQGPAGHVGDNLVASGEDQAVVRVPPKGGRHRMILGQLESVKPNRSAVQQGIDFTVEQIPCGCAVGGYEFLAAVHLAEVHSGGDQVIADIGLGGRIAGFMRHRDATLSARRFGAEHSWPRSPSADQARRSSS